MSDEEGAICDNCGSRIGLAGCCATVKGLAAEVEQLEVRAVEGMEWKARAAAAELAVLRIQEWIGQTTHEHEDTEAGYECRRCWIEKECRAVISPSIRELEER